MQNRFIQYGIGVILGVIVLMVILDRKKESKKAAPGETKIDQLIPFFNGEWAKNPIWNDGKIETAIYAANYTQNGKQYAFDYTSLTSKEVFNNEFTVKTNDTTRTDRYEVIKQNVMYSVNIDGQQHNYSASIFTLFKNPLLLVKYIGSSQEAAGTTFKSYVNKEKLFEMDYNSYHDREGKGSRMIPNTVLFEDQLPFTLRTLRFAPELSFKQKVLQTQVSNNIGELLRYSAIFRVADADSLWKVSVQLDSSKVNEYFFRKEYPNVMTSQSTWDGRKLALKSVGRR